MGNPTRIRELGAYREALKVACEDMAKTSCPVDEPCFDQDIVKTFCTIDRSIGECDRNNVDCYVQYYLAKSKGVANAHE